jgi:hypothetical protein
LAWSVIRPHDLAAVPSSPKNLDPSRAAIADVLEGKHPKVLRTDRDIEKLLGDLRRALTED